MLAEIERLSGAAAALGMIGIELIYKSDAIGLSIAAQENSSTL